MSVVTWNCPEDHRYTGSYRPMSFFYLRNLFCRPDCQLKSVDISLTGALLPLRLLSVSVSTADAQRAQASTATGAAASVSDAVSGLGGVSGLRESTESTETDGVTLKSWLVCIMFQRRRILPPVYSNSIYPLLQLDREATLAAAPSASSNPDRATRRINSFDRMNPSGGATVTPNVMLLMVITKELC